MKHAPQGPRSREIHETMLDSQRILSLHLLKEIQSSIGNVAQLTLPNGIKPHLEALIEASTPDFYAEHEHAYWELYRETVELCRQGWHSFNYWISLEQSTCYRLYWDLKKIAEKYGKPLIVRTKIPHESLPFGQQKIMAFLKGIARFLHLHEFEYYRWIATHKDIKKNKLTDE
jgi:hypothetical protein